MKNRVYSRFKIETFGIITPSQFQPQSQKIGEDRGNLTTVNVAYNLLRPVAFRGKYRLANALVPTTGVRRASVFGYQMELDLADYIQRSIYAGLWEVEETAQVRRILRRGMTCVDVGANVGYYTALAPRLVGEQGRCWRLSPEPHVLDDSRGFLTVTASSRRCVRMSVSATVRQ